MKKEEQIQKLYQDLGLNNNLMLKNKLVVKESVKCLVAEYKDIFITKGRTIWMVQDKYVMNIKLKLRSKLKKQKLRQTS